MKQPSDDCRILVWFSCGAASAVAAHESMRLWGKDRVTVVNCDTRADEHPDNYRFCEDVSRWLGVPITYLRSRRFRRVDEVFEQTRYMSGVSGARCTTELKKIPRLEFAQPGDWHVFGFTKEEGRRVRDFESRNPDLRLLWPLYEQGITKGECLRRLSEAGIALPAMYRLGFRNNNCIGCVKASSPWYWDRVRHEFPHIFAIRAARSRQLGCRLVEIKHHKRIFLDELPAGPFKAPRKLENLSCGPECGGPPTVAQNLLSPSLA